ncbi:MAG: branched-chain amino acid transport system substrate-binding protein [Betaproteobacteria bacterium]|jgi:branched-chain amino acid transport system substrate-binding protein|nr:branched-chain amino acid transport system substrate-binding protein [Betaproteobacteria bacterium]
MKRILFLFFFFSLAAQGADKVKIGFISTLSGPNASIGTDIRDGFNLAVKLNGAKLGGLPAEVLVSDDQLKPENAKQIAERYLQKDKVDFITGIVFSNVVMAVAPDAIASKVFFISPNAGPAPFTGAQCSPFFFAASWPSEAYSEAAGQYVTSKGLKNVVFLAPNYVGGHDAATGFKRYYKGKLVEEMYTKLGQLDYAAELSQIRAAKPEALYVFLPGGMGINFIKQFVASGMSRDIQLIVPLWGSDQDIIRAVGDPMLGLFSVSHWSIDFDNPANKKFVAEFEKEYRRLPTGYAATGYDTAMLIDSAVRKVKGKIENKDALRAAIRSADFKSVRGDFKFGKNQFPVQNYYLQLVGKGPDGRIVHKTMGTVLTNRGDAYVQDCKMQ